jgi:hypothetical protein
MTRTPPKKPELRGYGADQNPLLSGRLYQAFRELGRAIRTEFLLRYLADPAVRTIIQAATNKSESFNHLV